ncbi:MAG: hypothetical protein KC978_15640, partial [Candidatus Omnitrophica bacterium]|nr:hypothetical protein [Candidatus Omnitrophota bacterium]
MLNLQYPYDQDEVDKAWVERRNRANAEAKCSFQKRGELPDTLRAIDQAKSVCVQRAAQTKASSAAPQQWHTATPNKRRPKMGTPFSSAPGHHTSASPFAFLPAGKALAVSLILSLMLSLAGTYLLAAMQKQEATSGEPSVIAKSEPEISSQATIRILCYPWAEITLTQKGSKRT